jgi:hypothetical protein
MDNELHDLRARAECAEARAAELIADMAELAEVCDSERKRADYLEGTIRNLRRAIACALCSVDEAREELQGV